MKYPSKMGAVLENGRAACRFCLNPVAVRGHVCETCWQANQRALEALRSLNDRTPK